MTQKIINIDSWTPACLKKAVSELSNGIKKEGKPSLFVNHGKLSPVTFYCYLNARFGKPNGFQMLLKKENDSDNLIHWHFSIIAGNESLEILGMNTRIEFWTNTKTQISEDDWNDLIIRIKDDFKKYGKEMSQVKKSLEHWNLFINPYNRIKGVVDKGKAQLLALDLKLEVHKTDSENDVDKFKVDLNKYIKNISHAAFLCTNLRMVAPVYAESFVNLLIFLLAKKEIKDDDRLYQDLVRKQIDIRVKSLPFYCQGFLKSPVDSDEKFKNFLRLMNKRNDVLHGNVDPQSLKFDEVWFDGYTPLFKDEKPFEEKATYHSLKHIEPEEVLKDIESVEVFIDYILSLLDEKIRPQIEAFLDAPYPGWREDTKRVGILFPGTLVDIRPVISNES